MNQSTTKFRKILPPCRIFTILAVSFLAGVFIASYFTFKFDLLLFALIILALLFTGLVNFILKNYWFYLAAFGLIFLFAGISYFSLFNLNHSVSLPYGESVVIEGKIIKRPDIDYRRQQVTLEVTSIKINNLDQKVLSGTNLLAKLPHYPAVNFGDTLRLTGKIEEPKQIEDFDYPAYLKRYLIFGIITPEKTEQLQVSSSTEDKFKKYLYQVPVKFEEAFNRTLPEPHASLASGILLGSKRNIPADFEESLSKTSLTHIIALSGFNITIIVAIITTLLVGYVGKKKVFWICLALITAFVFLTGVSSSALRAAIFSMMIVFGRTLGRSGDMTNLALFAAIIMILFNPYILVNDTGFQLSFLAFAGLLYLTPVFNRIFDRYKKVPLWLRSSLAETLGAQLAVAPLILSVFGVLSLVGPLANIAVVWIVPFAMLGSFITGCAALIYYPLGKLSILLSWPLLEYIIRVTQIFSHFPSSAIAFEKTSLALEIGFFLLILTFILYYNRKYKLKLMH